MGDFNAKLGLRNTGEENVMGPYGIKTRNENGKALFSFAMENRLKISNSFFKKNLKNRWTWISPDGRTTNEIDYILTNVIRRFKDVHVVSRINFNTDHRLLRSKINLKGNRINRHNYNKTNQIKTVTQNNEYEYKQHLKNNLLQLQHLEPDCTAQEFYNKIEEIITKCLSLIKQLKEDKEIKLSQETKQILAKKDNLYKKIKKTDQDKIELIELKKLVKKAIKRDITTYRDSIISAELEKKTSTKRINKNLRTYTTWIPSLKLGDQENCHNRIAIQKKAKEYYQVLYKSKDPRAHNCNSTALQNRNDEPIPPFLQSEIQHAIKTLKKEKAAGPDKIPNEAIIHGKDELVEPITTLFNKILMEEITPIQWTLATIILIFKKGDIADLNNYRPISLLPAFYKLFMKVMLNRLSKTLDNSQPREQAGFRSGYSTTDHLHCITQIIEKCQEYQKPLFLAFIDFTKAFDSIEHHHIWKSLAEQGIATKYINILANIYKQSTAHIKLENTTASFKIERGVKQGDPLSPKLFNAVLESIFRNVDDETRGIIINGEKLSNLRFADDVTLLEENEENLQTQLNNLAEESLKVGLTININKSKIMTNRKLTTPITLANEPLETVTEFTYLGQAISFTNKTNTEISKRIGNAWKKFWALKHILLANFPLYQKKKIMDMCILPILTYGAQTWALNKENYLSIRSAQRKMERTILKLKLKDRIKSSIIRSKTKIIDAIISSRRIKWNWAGHTIRRKDNRWTYLSTIWLPLGNKRKRGRQITRWRDEINNFAGATWPRKAAIRKEWETLAEEFVGRLQLI